jgi:AsmA protein
MKALRIIGITFAVFLPLLIAGVALLYALFDGDKIKAEISRAVLEQEFEGLTIHAVDRVEQAMEVVRGLG